MSLLNHKYWKTLPGPENIFRAELPNGIILLSRRNDNSPSVALSGYLGCGSLFDPPEKLGLAHFTALTLMRGTARNSFQTIFNTLESAGASLGFGASVHNTSFGGRSLAEDLPTLLGLLAEALQTPVFPPDQVNRLRDQLLTSLAIRAQDTADMASLIFDETVFPGHPYGKPEDGTIESIKSIEIAELAAFHARHYGPRGMVVVIVGAVQPEQALEEVTRALGSWQNPQQPEPPVLPVISPLKETIRHHLPLPGKTQTDIVMGSLGPQRKSPDYLPASLGNSILGQFGMMGRIGDVVREQSGLAYNASTSLNAWIEAGSWEVSAGVNPVNVQRAIDLILKELKRFVSEPVTPDELQDSQANYIGRLPLSLESNNGVANALLNLERFQLGLDYYQRFAGLVESVTPVQILETARHFIDPEKLAIISSGPELNGA